jgi:hypothetical protein
MWSKPKRHSKASIQYILVLALEYEKELFACHFEAYSRLFSYAIFVTTCIGVQWVQRVEGHTEPWDQRRCDQCYHSQSPNGVLGKGDIAFSSHSAVVQGGGKLPIYYVICFGTALYCVQCRMPSREKSVRAL